MTKPTYLIKGTDVETHAPSSLSVQASSVPEAADIAGSRGIDIVSVESEHGDIYTPVGDGRFRTGVATEGNTSKSNDDLGLMLVSFLIPIIGIIAGSVRLGNRDQSGVPILLAAVAGIVVWGIVAIGMAGG